MPSDLFPAGSSLMSKVEMLRMHLEERLGGPDAFARVYDFVCREEAGDQQSGEREAVLAFLAHKSNLLPLVCRCQFASASSRALASRSRCA
eukprot:3701848-Pleurochrysis_carterae.AAC.1